MESQQNRPHRPSKEKKKPQKGQKNVKAFAVANPGRLAKEAVRSSDIKEKRLHVPQVDRLPEEAPPIVVAVVGPPGVGKTTLIKSLIKRYSKQTLSHPTGPLTVVTSKRRRLTFLECPSDSLAAMIDVAKIADIVLLMIDGNYGFEMETMEFLNALSTSGMPGNVFGILTHLDLFKKQSTLRMAKKRLKHRFWSELYQGAKLFYLSGVINGRYPDREVHNLSRFLSIMKNPRPLIWRNSHPYCLADRFLDVTPPTAMEENEKCDRQVALYGYLRGTNFPADGARVHVPGVGDLTVREIEALPDPCPTPYLDQAMAKATGKSNRRKLGEKQKVLFAPMSDVGGVLVDKDAVYIDIKTNTFDRDADDLEDRGLGEQLMMNLQGERKLLGEVDKGVRLFQGGQELNGENDTGRSTMRGGRTVDGRGAAQADLEEEESDDEGFVSGGSDLDEDNGLDDEEEASDYPDHSGLLGLAGDERSDGGLDENLDFAESDSDMGSISGEDNGIDGLSEADSEDFDGEEDEDEDDGALRWKENLMENAKRSHGSKAAFRAADLSRLMYDLTLDPRDVIKKWSGQATELKPELEEEDEDQFFRKAKTELEEESEDRPTPRYNFETLAQKWEDEDQIQSLMSRFTKGSMATGANTEGVDDGGDDLNELESDESDEGDGDFEDLEAAGDESPVAKEEVSLEEERAKNAKRKEELKLRFEEEDREGFANAKNEGTTRVEDGFGEDDWYDAQKAMLQKQLDINRAEFDILDPTSRARAEGFKAGTYARIVLDRVPYEFVRSFSTLR